MRFSAVATPIVYAQYIQVKINGGINGMNVYLWDSYGRSDLIVEADSLWNVWGACALSNFHVLRDTNLLSRKATGKDMERLPWWNLHEPAGYECMETSYEHYSGFFELVILHSRYAYCETTWYAAILRLAVSYKELICVPLKRFGEWSWRYLR